MLRSSTRVAKTVERYAALMAVYVDTLKIAAAVNAANARQAGSSRRAGSQSDASPAIAGRTPSPIANADPAWKPRLHIRCLNAWVTTAYSGEWSLTS